MALAQRVMEPGDGESAETMTRLAELIAHSIDSGRERSVMAAINALSVHGDADAAKEVGFLASDAAQVLEITPLRQSPGGTEAVAGQAVLFVIPVVLIGAGERTAPVALTNEGADGSALGKAARSFRDAGLIGSEPSVVLAPYLYRMGDLPIDWEGWRRLHRVLLGQRQAASGVSDLPVPGETEQHDISPPNLRYMLVSVRSALGEPDPGPLLTGADEDDEFDALIEAWADAYTKILSAGLEGVRGSFSGAWWMGGHDMDENIEAVREFLESARVTRVVAAEQIYQGEPRCEKCGEPLFPAITRKGFRHAEPPDHPEPGPPTSEQSRTLH